MRPPLSEAIELWDGKDEFLELGALSAPNKTYRTLHSQIHVTASVGVL